MFLLLQASATTVVAAAANRSPCALLAAPGDRCDAIPRNAGPEEQTVGGHEAAILARVSTTGRRNHLQPAMWCAGRR